MTTLRSLFDLSGKVAVITGGSRGLGLQIASALGELGASVALVARKEEELKNAVALLTSQGIAASAFPSDLSNARLIEPLITNIIGQLNRIDILVNNAATAWAQPAEEHSIEGWRKVMATNVESLFLITQEIGRREMIPRRSGKILNVASIGGMRGNRPQQDAHTLAYNTSKGAVLSFTRTLAAEWGRHGINVNALCPGFFRSTLAGGLLDKIETQIVESTPLGRIGEDKDMKGAAAFLCSDASRHVTGQAIVVDGGMSAC